jgi:hypothetical protein
LAWFGEAFAFKGKGCLVFFEDAVGGGANGQEFIPDGRCDAEGGPQGDIVRLPAHKGGKELRIFGKNRKKARMRRREETTSLV